MFKKCCRKTDAFIDETIEYLRNELIELVNSERFLDAVDKVNQVVMDKVGEIKKEQEQRILRELMTMRK